VTERDEGYVHDPDDFDGDGTLEADAADGPDADANSRRRGEADPTADDRWLEDPVHPETTDREFGTRGWILVGMIFVAFIVAPGVILLIPPGTDYLLALLIVPLVPAVALALTAVWATTRP